MIGGNACAPDLPGPKFLRRLDQRWPTAALSSVLHKSAKLARGHDEQLTFVWVVAAGFLHIHMLARQASKYSRGRMPMVRGRNYQCIDRFVL